MNFQEFLSDEENQAEFGRCESRGAPRSGVAALYNRSGVLVSYRVTRLADATNIQAAGDL
jgi:hypothetical protein